MNGPSKNTIEKSMALPTVLYEEIHIFYHGELARREYEMYHKLIDELEAENKQQMAIIEEQAAIIAELEAKIEQQDAQIEQLEAKRIQLEEQLAEKQQQKGEKLEKDVAGAQLMRKRSCIDDDIFVHDSAETKKLKHEQHFDKEAEVGTSSSNEQPPKPSVEQKDEEDQQKKE